MSRFLDVVQQHFATDTAHDERLRGFVSELTTAVNRLERLGDGLSIALDRLGAEHEAELRFADQVDALGRGLVQVCYSFTCAGKTA
jgi:hypothetical protein